MGMTPGAEIWEKLLYEAIRTGTNYPLSQNQTHGLSKALRSLMVEHIMQHGKLVIPYFGRFEIRRHKGGVTVVPPRGKSKRVDVPPYNKLYFRANQRVRHEIQNYEGGDNA